MRTERFIDLLARDAGPAPRIVPLARMMPVAGIGFAVALATAWAAMGLADEARALAPAFWMKTVYAAAIAVAAAWWLDRLAHPAAPTRRPIVSLTVIVIVMAVAGVAGLLRAGTFAAPLLGRSWALCPWAIALLALPSVAGLLLVVRTLAPVQPARSGFAAGLLGGAIGAAAYAFACYETSPAFIAVWYTAGIALSGAVGAAAGSRLLRG